MLLLFETPAGFALFTVLQENKLQEAEVGAGKSAQSGVSGTRMCILMPLCPAGPLERL